MRAIYCILLYIKRINNFLVANYFASISSCYNSSCHLSIFVSLSFEGILPCSNQNLGSFIQKILTINIYHLHTPYYTKNLDGDEPKSRCCAYYISRDVHINQYLRRIKKLIAQTTPVANFLKQLTLQRLFNSLVIIHTAAWQIPIRPPNLFDNQNLPNVVVN